MVGEWAAEAERVSFASVSVIDRTGRNPGAAVHNRLAEISAAPLEERLRMPLRGGVLGLA
jgi:hypothetical protein